MVDREAYPDQLHRRTTSAGLIAVALLWLYDRRLSIFPATDHQPGCSNVR